LNWVISLPTVEVVSTITMPSLAWGGSNQWLRDWIAGRIGLAAHIERPPGSFRPMASVGASFLLFGRHGGETYFDSITNPGELVAAAEKPWFHSYSAWLNGHRPDRGFTKQAATVRSWSVAQNDPTAEAARSRLTNLGPTTPLGELFDILLPPNVPSDLIFEEADDEAVEVIDARRLRSADADRRYVINTFAPEISVLRDGDLLIPRTFTANSRTIEFSSGRNAIAGPSILVLRPKELIESRYVCEYLNSNTGRRLIETCTTGTVVPQLSTRMLKEVPVPLISIDLSKSVAEIDKTQSTLVAITEEIEASRSALFDVRTKDEFLAQLEGLRRKASLTTEALEFAGSFDFQISQLFPFPLAFGYRMLRGFLAARHKVQEQLRAAENILAFLGSVSIALLDEADRHSMAEDFRTNWRGGISPGHWKEIIQKCSERFRGYNNHPLAAAIQKLNIANNNRGFGKEVGELIQMKNDFKHDRGPKIDDEFIPFSQRLEACLDKVMRSLDFWTRFPIRQVRSCDLARRSIRFELKCLRVVGDHPGFRQEELMWHEPLRRNQLYLEIAERRWVPLQPYLLTHVCSRCQMEEVYFIDRWDGRDKARIKSFERGHAEDSDEVGTDLHDALIPATRS
jgi:hypothetical protein